VKNSYIICLTIAPVFFAASIYLILSRIIVHYGIHHARISPKAISLTFMGCDFIALVLQATGGAIADTAGTPEVSHQGTHIMVGGLGFQVLSLLLFIALAVEFALNVRRDRGVEKQGVNGRSERSFKRFLVGMSHRFLPKHGTDKKGTALALTTLFILTRSSFRVAELAKGFGSKLANEEVPFMILEGAMIVLATASMTAFHPGRAFGEKWVDAGWSWKKGDVESNRGNSELSASSQS
jgi:hypothetical protein